MRHHYVCMDTLYEKMRYLGEVREAVVEHVDLIIEGRKLNVHTIVGGEVAGRCLGGTYCLGFYPEEVYRGPFVEWHYPVEKYKLYSSEFVSPETLMLIYGKGIETITFRNLTKYVT